MDPATPSDDRTSVLFVCLGNICRSPLAEGVFRDLVNEAGLERTFTIDSAGTGGWHVGEAPDSRATMVAQRHGVTLDSAARQVTERDLVAYDYLIAMDRDNLAALSRMSSAQGADPRLHLLREFDTEGDGDEVPDPYYGGASGFESVYEMISRSCRGLLDHILAER